MSHTEDLNLGADSNSSSDSSSSDSGSDGFDKQEIVSSTGGIPDAVYADGSVDPADSNDGSNNSSSSDGSDSSGGDSGSGPDSGNDFNKQEIVQSTDGIPDSVSADGSVDPRGPEDSGNQGGTRGATVRTTVSVEDQRKGIADEKNRRAEIKQQRLNLEENREYVLKQPADSNFKVGGEILSRGEVLDRLNKDLNKVQEGERILTKAIRNDQNIIGEDVITGGGGSRSRDSSGNQNFQAGENVRVQGQDGELSQEGADFLNRRRQLQSLPTYPQLEDNAFQQISRGENPFTRSLSGELIEAGIGRQLFEAGQTAGDVLKKDTIKSRAARGIFDITTPAFNEQQILTAISPGQENQGEPREAFKQTAAPLSVAQDRAQEFVSQAEKKTPDQLEDLAVEAIETGVQFSNPTLSPLLREGTATEQGFERALRLSPGGVIKEIPEKLVETSALAGASAATLRDPGRVGAEIGLGSGKILEEAGKDPLKFGVQEIAADAGLDILTGSAPVATIVPSTQVRRIGGKTRQKISDTSLKDVVSNTRKGQSQISRPDNGPALGPDILGPTTTQQIEVIQPDQFETLDVFTETETITSNPLLESVPSGVVVPDTGPRNEVIAESGPGIEAISETVPTTEPLTIEEALAETVPATETVSLADTRTETLPEIIPETVPETVPSILTETSGSSDDSEDGLFSSLFGGSEDFKFESSLGAEILGIEGNKEDLTDADIQNPLNLRPVLK